MIKEKTAQELLNFIHRAVSPFHSVEAGVQLLEQSGFWELLPEDTWKLRRPGKYFVRVYGSSLMAFVIGRNPRAELHIASAHTDFPCLRIKPAAAVQANGYGRLNVEVYGGMIRSTWMDRPLSFAGKVVLQGEDAFHPEVRLVNLPRPVMTIPSLAIHMNRKVNEGVELNPQKDMLPLLTMTEDEEEQADFFTGLLAGELSCAREKILSYDLTVYPVEQGCLLGRCQEFISSPRIDNLTSVKACLGGLISGKRQEGLHVAALFDNEEVGSRTKQGAGSLVLPMLLERIYLALGFTRADYLQDIAGGFMLSVDVAHAMHPNVPEKNDITNKPVLNGGVALKLAASQSYAGDAEAAAIVTALCRQADIPYQYFVNRSDEKGGSTLGSILSALLPLRTMDIGVPILAMHSARETMGAADQPALEALVQEFFSGSKK